MKKIFKANDSTSDKRVLEITDWTKPGVSLVVDNPGIWGHGIVIPPSDAPALALAILEAAGLVRDSCSGDDAEVALEWLHSAVARRQREAKEAADREALERRRDDLAKELECAAYGQHETGVKYIGMTATTWAAIDRIIELEDRATK